MKNQMYNQLIEDCCKKIAPLWPLKNYVAVNPYMGLSDLHFQDAAKLLSERSSIRMTLPLSFYLEKLDQGEISLENLKQALVQNGRFQEVEDYLFTLKSLDPHKTVNERLKTVLDLFNKPSQRDPNEIMIDSVSSWAASYFDNFQAIWNAPSEKPLFDAWFEEAQVDLSPEIAGIGKFRKTISLLPKDRLEVQHFIIDELGVSEEQLEAYLHTLLLKILGWASFISGMDWNNQMYHSPTQNLSDFLTIILCWEYAFFTSVEDSQKEKIWTENLGRFARVPYADTNSVLEHELILQDAFDLAHEHAMLHKINTRKQATLNPANPKAQAIFCIDVRSETLRRHIENHDDKIETLGFAGFFAFPINYKPIGFDKGKNQCPVLIPSGPIVNESSSDQENLEKTRNRKISNDTFTRLFKLFKSGATSAFSFVSPYGVFFLSKLIKDSFRFNLKKGANFAKTIEVDSHEVLDLSEIPFEQKLDMSASFLTLSGLKDRLTPLVTIIGHGSSSTNNPHASGLECGACGGHSGKINALTAAQILNDPKIRKRLLNQNIQIPNKTLFVAGLHDTTSDELTLYPDQNLSTDHRELIQEIQDTFSKASATSRTERSLRFSERGYTNLISRGMDWSQVRPEWGLAGCHSFIVAPRSNSRGLDLQGKTFLHNYNWKHDADLKILETIMTAPMVVTSWINLQYYASVTDQQNLGAGNKTLHNVTAGIGVIEGSGGDLKTGLPLQSVHDGEHFQHLPNRLCVFIGAPIKNINSILEKHHHIKQLFDNQWLTLFSLNDDGKVENKYLSNLNWDSISAPKKTTKQEYQII
ncbi:MAG: DUF2309 domain-containing protein [Bacteroidetes bacterium]|nr:MAG: DUF2309 domain-containing protein [Bacteroidota bacterium]